MKKVHNPNGVPATYSDGIEVAAGGRMLFTAGQVAFREDKSVPEGIVAQTKQTFANVESVLKAGGMGLENIVKMTVFMTNPDDFAEFSKTRIEIMGGNKPASTLVYVSGLVMPELLIEIEAIAIAS